MTLYTDDAEVSIAIGWLTGVVGGRRLADESHRAATAGYAETARHFLRWADNQVSDETMIEWQDRERQWAADRDAIVRVIFDMEEEAEELDVPF